MTAQGDSSHPQSDTFPAQGCARHPQGDTLHPQGDAKTRKGTFFAPGPCNNRSKPSRIAALAALALAGCASGPAPISLTENAPAQRAWTQACKDWDDWDKAGPAFRVHANTYYVGTCGIAALLVVGPQGHVLIDSGTDKGADVVLENIRSLGFFPKDVKTLLMTHEHFDHIGGMAKLQAATGATIIATAPAVQVLRTGKPTAADPQANAGHPAFEGAKGKIVTLAKFTAQKLAGRDFQPISTPGHTPGAVSWRWRDCDENRDCKTIVYIDSLNAISGKGYRFSARPAYVSAFRKGIAAIAASPCDIGLAPHPSSADLRNRLLKGSLVDRQSCKAYANAARVRLDARLAEEKKGG